MDLFVQVLVTRFLPFNIKLKPFKCILSVAALLNDTIIQFVSDIDECSKNGSPCNENAECFNNDGSFSCICKDGFTGNGTVCLGKSHFNWNDHYTVVRLLLLLLLLFVVVVVIVVDGGGGKRGGTE